MRALLIATIVALALVGANPEIRADEITIAQVRESIEKAVSYLKQRQHPDGSWGEWLGQRGGVTALCTLALVNAGVPVDDPQMQLALQNLRKIRPASTYVTSLQTMVFCKATPIDDKLLISRNVKWLEDKQIMEGPRKGGWSYPGAAGDNSNSQFALLALYEADQVNIPVNPQTWRLAKFYWEDGQNPDGSWAYLKGLPGSGSMTCAGIASLVIADDKVSPSDAQANDDKITCCAQGSPGNPALERGLEWMGRNFTVRANPGYPGWLLYYLYGVERVGRMTARRFIGAHDWYREGTAILVPNQDSLSGFWKGIGHAEDDPEIATSLVLLFLSKGRRPVLMAKLKHSGSDDWNQHRSDVANLTRYVEPRWNRDLTWQVIDLKAATAEDLLQAPVLYFCGSVSPLPSDPADQNALATKLRDYVDRGGFLFAEAYCGGTGFDTGFRRLLEKVFPEAEYRLRLLPPEHPIWHAEENVSPAHLRTLEGIDYGCRTSVVYAPLHPRNDPGPSLSCLWELSRQGRGRKLNDKVQAQVDAAMTIGINILAYATNRELSDKNPFVPQAVASGSGDRGERGRLRIATLRHPGGCNAAPRALVNLLEAAARELHVRVDGQQHLLSITDEALFDYPLVFMHGRNNFRLTDAERKQLKSYVERGGIVFADAICTSRQFAESFRREMEVIFPAQPLRPIPANDPLFTPTYGGYDVTQVTRRDPQIRSSSDPLKAALHRVPPSLEAITIAGHYGVIFSPYDLSCALEKQDSLECQGYVREDAGRIGLNIVLYALHE